MKKLAIQVTNKQYYLLERIAKADDRRLNDLLYLIFSSGLGVYFCEKSVYISKDDNEFTENEIEQKKLNNKLIEENDKFHSLSDDEQKKLGFKEVELSYNNYGSYNKKDFIDDLAEEIKNNALNEIKKDYKEIEENIIKENTLKEDTEYCVVNGTNEKSIVNGKKWEQSEVKNND